MKAFLRSLPWLLLVIALLAPAHSARADAAPPLAPQIGGLSLQYQPTNVQMVYEWVEMTLETQNRDPADSDTSEIESQVLVHAYFVLNNRGSAVEEMQVIFPLESFTDCTQWTNYRVNPKTFRAFVDGVEATIQPVESDIPYSSRCNVIA